MLKKCKKLISNATWKTIDYLVDFVLLIHNSRKRIYKILLCLLIIILIILAILSVIYAEEMGAERASMIGGLWSALATAALGGIAFWQNKKYKQMADLLDMRQNAPEFIITSLRSIDKEASNIKIQILKASGEHENGVTLEISIANPFFVFVSLDKPMLNLSIEKVIIDNTIQKIDQWSINKLSFYSPQNYFVFKLLDCFPKDHSEHELCIVFQYENIYGVKYEKKFISKFTVFDNGIMYRNPKLEKATPQAEN